MEYQPQVLSIFIVLGLSFLVLGVLSLLIRRRHRHHEGHSHRGLVWQHEEEVGSTASQEVIVDGDSELVRECHCQITRRPRHWFGHHTNPMRTFALGFITALVVLLLVGGIFILSGSAIAENLIRLQ